MIATRPAAASTQYVFASTRNLFSGRDASSNEGDRRFGPFDRFCLLRVETYSRIFSDTLLLARRVKELQRKYGYVLDTFYR